MGAQRREQVAWGIRAGLNGSHAGANGPALCPKLTSSCNADPTPGLNAHHDSQQSHAAVHARPRPTPEPNFDSDHLQRCTPPLPCAPAAQSIATHTARQTTSSDPPQPGAMCEASAKAMLTAALHGAMESGLSLDTAYGVVLQVLRQAASAATGPGGGARRGSEDADPSPHPGPGPQPYPRPDPYQGPASAPDPSANPGPQGEPSPRSSATSPRMSRPRLKPKLHTGAVMPADCRASTAAAWRPAAPALASHRSLSPVPGSVQGSVQSAHSPTLNGTHISPSARAVREYGHVHDFVPGGRALAPDVLPAPALVGRVKSRSYHMSALRQVLR